MSADDAQVSSSGHSAFVEDAPEARMGSPQYGRLLLDGEEIAGMHPGAVESTSLVWSENGALLAVQEWDYSIPYPGTRVVVIDADRRVKVAASRERSGLSRPIRFDVRTLIYRHSQYGRVEEELRLEFH